MIPETLQIQDPPEGFQLQLHAVIDQIPPTDWNRVLEYWSKRKRNGDLFLNCITFVEDAGEEACTFPRGRRIQFQRRIWRERDSDYILELIAHELAHVYDWCAGPATEIKGIGEFEPPETSLKMERRAIEMAQRWGFKIPGGRLLPSDVYKKYADRMLSILPPEHFTPSHSSVVYLRGVSESGHVPLSPREQM